MRLAIIDLGTNSVRFDVHELGPDNQVYKLHREKLMIRLGEDVFLKGVLNRRSREICLAAFLSFQQTMKDFKVNRVIAFATSALREAKDAEKLIREIKRKTGIKIKIISGDEEAGLIARGILANEVGIRGNTALVDIGGGSTEVIVCFGREIVRKASFELGTARLQQVFLKSIPPASPASGALHPVEALRRHIRGTLLYKLVAENWPKSSRILGASGTTKALVRIVRRRTGRNFIDRKTLSELVDEMTSKTRTELSRIPGMEARRVDMILAGAVLLEECMMALHAERVEATEFSLRDGILDEQMDLMSANRKSFIFDPVSDLLETAIDMGARKENLQLSLRVADLVFDRLKMIHRLKPDMKVYLQAASLLHDCGKSISAIDSESHSAYVAKFADVPVFEDWQSDLICELCFYAKNGKIAKKDMPFKKDRDLQRSFLKLLALLRLVVALSYQRTFGLKIERVRIDRSRVVLSISKRSKASLQILRVEQRKGLFEDVFKKTLALEEV